MKETVYNVASTYYRWKRHLANSVWNIKFKLLCTYYKGGANIPPDVLGKWCPFSVTSLEAAMIGAAEPIHEMFKLFGTDVNEDYVMLVLGAFMRGDKLSFQQAKMARRVFLSTYPAKQYFRYLYIYGNTRKIKYILSNEVFMKTFRELLTRQNKHLTLTMSV